MNWTEVKIFTSTQGIEPLTNQLMDLGINGFVIEDAQDFNAFLQDPNPRWDYVDDELMKLKNCETNIKLYVPDNLQGMEELALIRELLSRLKRKPEQDFGTLEMELNTLNEEDWSTAWKKYYHPIRVGSRLLISPSWEKPYGQGLTKQDDDIVLTLNPGMAFGTGTHDTTRLCMQMLEGACAPGDAVLDVGCGSGILAVAAALLGAGKVTGCDIDQVAVEVAIENAQLNNVADKISFHKGDLTSAVQGKFDVICANIVADIIIRLCTDIPVYMKEKGMFIASGIIEEREQEVVAAMHENGLEILECCHCGGWVAISATKSSKA